MVHCGTLCRAIPNGNRRAANSRPYADCATELPPQIFRCAVGVVRRAANQNPMIAGGDHSIIQRISSARQRSKFLSRNVLAEPGFQCWEYAMFRHNTIEFSLQIFDTALSALCADVVFPEGKQPGGYYPPLRPPKSPGGNLVPLPIKKPTSAPCTMLVFWKC